MINRWKMLKQRLRIHLKNWIQKCGYINIQKFWFIKSNLSRYCTLICLFYSFNETHIIIILGFNLLRTWIYANIAWTRKCMLWGIVKRDEFYARLNIFMRHHVLDRLLFVCSQSVIKWNWWLMYSNSCNI